MKTLEQFLNEVTHKDTPTNLMLAHTKVYLDNLLPEYMSMFLSETDWDEYKDGGMKKDAVGQWFGGAIESESEIEIIEQLFLCAHRLPYTKPKHVSNIKNDYTAEFEKAWKLLISNTIEQLHKNADKINDIITEYNEKEYKKKSYDIAHEIVMNNLVTPIQSLDGKYPVMI
jgi:hypothetical protein